MAHRQSTLLSIDIYMIVDGVVPALIEDNRKRKIDFLFQVTSAP
jgi:hypothetical protein